MPDEAATPEEERISTPGTSWGPMNGLLSPSRASRTGRHARRALLATTVVVALCALAYAWPVAVNDPMKSPLMSYKYVQRGTDYVAWTDVFPGMRDHHVVYTANGTLRDLLLLRQGDVADLLAGEAVTPLQRLDPASPLPGGVGFTHGRVTVRPPAATCPPPTGACLDASLPVLVWVVGDDWQGESVDGAKIGTTRVEYTAKGHATSSDAEGPLQLARIATSTSVADTWRVVMPAAVAAAVVGVGAAVVWIAAEARAVRSGTTTLRASVLARMDTESMLHMARLVTLHVEGVKRSFVVMGFAIPLVALALMFAGVPPMLAASGNQHALAPDMLLHDHLFFLGIVPYLALVALLQWSVSYLRVRRELKRWSEAADAFETDAARVLGA